MTGLEGFTRSLPSPAQRLTRGYAFPGRPMPCRASSLPLAAFLAAATAWRAGKRWQAVVAALYGAGAAVHFNLELI